MPDIAVDYELLNDVAQKAKTLKGQVQQARESRQVYSVDEVGSTTAQAAIRKYYLTWSSAFKRSEDKLDKLSQLYDGVAKQWANWDFNLAKDAAKQGASIASDRYNSSVEEWNAWHNTVEQYKKDNPDWKPSDLPKEPEKPGERPSQWTTTDGKGNSTTTTYEYGPDGRPTKVTTTIKTNTGLTATDTTEYHPDGTYDGTSTDAHGNVTKTKGNSQVSETPQGRTTKDDFTSTTTEPDGKVTTTTGTTSSVTNPATGQRDTTTKYTTVGPDEKGKEQTVTGTTTTSTDSKGHQTSTTIEVKKDGSGTKTVVVDGRTEEWTSNNARGDTGWTPKKPG